MTAYEPHFDCLVPHVNGFVRLADQVNDKALQFVVDTGWMLMQSEHPSLVVHRLRKKIGNVHFRDVNAQTRSFAPFGQRLVDAPQLAPTLKSARYAGYLTLAEVFIPEAQCLADCKLFIKTMQENG